MSLFQRVSLCAFIMFVIGSQCVFAQGVSFEDDEYWAKIGNAGNAADNTTYGSVGYYYRMGKYEITNEQYAEFLNAVAATDTYALYVSSMGSYGITQSGSSGSYTYTVTAGWEERPAAYISWYDVLRFVNWLNNGKPTGVAQVAGTTETGAYTLTSTYAVTPYDENNLHDPSATYWLPTEDEWYKAAYYNGVSAVYYNYATGSDSVPTAEVPPGGSNSACYSNVIGSPYYRSEVGAYENSPSPYGTYDQTGNVEEWTEAMDGSNRYTRGGYYSQSSSYISVTARNARSYSNQYLYIGFRVASSYPVSDDDVDDIINDAQNTVPQTWTGADITGLTNLFLTTQTSYTASTGETWYYNNVNYNTAGYWGKPHPAGSVWTDQYGYTHINIKDGKGLTTCGEPQEWLYIAEAGYTKEVGDAGLFAEMWNKTKVDTLYNLYLAGSGDVVVGNKKWTFEAIDPSGRSYGEYWEEDGTLYIYLSANACLTGLILSFNDEEYWAKIGNAGNTADNTTYGSVGYYYRMGKYEITNEQYAEFLNAVAATDTYALYVSSMGSYGITQSGSSGSYTYTVTDGWAEIPASYISWFDVLRFINWLNNGKPTGEQGVGTTETGAYTLTSTYALTPYDENNLHDPSATYWLPTENEWYKAAYYNGVSAVYYNYPTGSDSVPTAELPPGGSNSASFNNVIGIPYFRSLVGEYENSPSPYGTYDQGGNVEEWTETIDGSNYYTRGGAYSQSYSALSVSSRVARSYSNQYLYIGFRVASSYPVTDDDVDDIISDAQNTVPQTWSGADITGLTNLFLTTQTSYTASTGETWYYNDVDYSEAGYWGKPHPAGSVWTDQYGYTHINIKDGKGLTTCAEPQEWLYIAKAGYSKEVGDAGVFAEMWNKTKVDNLYNLYLAGSGDVVVGNKKWTFEAIDISGRTYGEYWEEDGTLYIYLSANACLTGLMLSFNDDEYWAKIGNAGNTVDNTAYGSVGYYYRMGKYEITNAQYAEFLNAVAATDTYGLYYSSMGSYGITQSGSSGSYTYTVTDGYAEMPASYISWFDVLRFINWLNNGKPTGVAQEAGTTETGAYTLTSVYGLQAYDENNLHDPSATYWLPTENEWYKAAYYNGVSAVYYNYPTGSDSVPTAELPPGGSNSASFNNVIGSPYFRSQVGEYENSPSPYGTYDQGGNVEEWTEATDGSNYYTRGGSYSQSYSALSVSSRIARSYSYQQLYIGFRVASSYPVSDDDVDDIINDAKNTLGQTWSGADVTGLTNLFLTTHTSYIPSTGETWYYNDVDYSESGYWGKPHPAGSVWTDQYGYIHINIKDGKGLTTCGEPQEWLYIAKAGYSKEVGDAGEFAEMWDKTRVDTLYNLYLAGSGDVVVGNKKWTFEAINISGRTYGEYWEEDGTLYIYLSANACLTGSVLSFNDDEYWQEILDFSNADDNTTYGSVDHYYRMAKYEITNAQYAEFLNAVAATDTYGLYYSQMSGWGITQSGSSGSFTYTVTDGWAERPVVYVSWFDALRFANWLCNGRPVGVQEDGTTETGAYTLTSTYAVTAYDVDNLHDPSATYWLPTEDEWYKAAYYDNDSGVYYNYPVGSDTKPTGEAPPGGVNSANYRPTSSTYALEHPYLSFVGAYENSPSPYGTYDQGGNVAEWNETINGSYRYLRGGSWSSVYTASDLAVTGRVSITYSTQNYSTGFRIAAGEVSAEDEIRNIINSAKSMLDKDWTTDDVNALINLFTTSQTSYTASTGETWYYNDVDYSKNGYWGVSHYTGGSWTDKYGYSHISVADDKGLTTCAEPQEWRYLAEVGYSESFAGTPFSVNWDKDQVDTLYNLFLAGEGSVIFANKQWSYTTEVISGRDYGEYWEENGVFYIYLADQTCLTGITLSFADAEYWVKIGNAGNTADDTGYGSVNHYYQIAKFEVTNAQYVEFLNAVAATDTYDLYNTNMANSTYYKAISRSGSSGSYTYSVNEGWEDRPVAYLSCFDILRFVNWLNNGKPTGLQEAGTTETGAYTLTGISTVEAYDENNLHNPSASYWLPMEDEWYKAAYYDNESAIYYDYPIGSDTLPTAEAPPGGNNSANYRPDGSSYAIGDPYYSTKVGLYEDSLSPYGTYDQGGNIFEWNGMLITGASSVARGGAWVNSYTGTDLLASSRNYYGSTNEYYYFGFRVASAYDVTDQDVKNIINDAKNMLGETWSQSDIDNLTSVFLTTHTSYTPTAGDTWYYDDVNYFESGYWGTAHHTGEVWTDKYGYIHIAIQDGKGLTTCGKSQEWRYIAELGYSGGLSFTETCDKDKVDTLYNLYVAGAGSLIIANKKWSYSDEEITGREYGESWEENGMLYIYLSDDASLICESISFDDGEYWTQIKNAGNTADDTGYGSVNYYYQMGKFEVTVDQYVEFLNAVAATDTYSLYNSSMAARGVTRSGSSGSYTYTANEGWEDRPVVCVVWYNALRFTNWLNNGKPTGLQEADTTETGAYTLTAISTVEPYDENNLHNPSASYWLPTEDEWYKAAYYDNDSAVYYDYPTGSDTQPTGEVPPGGENSANYKLDSSTFVIGTPYYSNRVGAYTNSESLYGTYDQGGNIYEWNETVTTGDECGLRGGSFAHYYSYMAANYSSSESPTQLSTAIGFRVASVYDVVDGDVANIINEAKTILGATWTGDDVSGLTDTFLTTHTNYTDTSSTTWYYSEGDYRETGYWGVAHYPGAVWTDKYGYKHIAIKDGAGLTTCDQPAVWQYISAAGYTEEIGETDFSEKWTTDQVDALYNLYLAGSGELIIGNKKWTYTTQTVTGHTYGDYWVENGVLYLYLADQSLLTGEVLSFEDADYWVIIPNAGNIADDTGYGTVGHYYRMGKFEVTVDQYVEFLNAVAATDTYSLYYTSMASWGISRSGSSGSYTYSINEGWKDRPVAYASWYSILRFTNWLNNGKPTGVQEAGTTEAGAYTLTAISTVVPYDADNLHDPSATYWLPTEDQWYKAAYYDNESSSLNGVYYEYPTGSDTVPTAETPPAGVNCANYYGGAGGLVDVGSYYYSPSPYGTYDQAGNLDEWNESLIGDYRGLRGGYFNGTYSRMAASTRSSYPPASGNQGMGFRVASSCTVADQDVINIIRDAKTTLGENWSEDDITEIVEVYLTSHTSYTASGDTWYYSDVDYNESGYWGVAHYTGAVWTDKYGYSHICVNNAGLTNCDQPQEWIYIASAGYTEELGEEPFAETWSKDKVDALYNLYLAGEGSMIVGSREWSYATLTVTGHTYGDYWEEDGVRYIYLADQTCLVGTMLSFDDNAYWAVIRRAGNTADTTGYGQVDYVYSIGKFEVTTAQYVEFLNAVAATDTYSLYSTSMTSNTYYKGIVRSGSAGSYTYTVNEGWGSRPVGFVSWYDALRFVNWLNNGKPTGLQEAGTTETGAYTLTSAYAVTPYDGNNLHDPAATYWLPTEDEWYKAAYFDPFKDGTTPGYWLYPTGSDSLPTAETPPGGENSANYYSSGYTIGAPYYTAQVGSYVNSKSPYGTYDQAGNAYEWNETISGTERGIRGGSFSASSTTLASSYSNTLYYSQEYVYNGFRVATSYAPIDEEVMDVLNDAETTLGVDWSEDDINGLYNVVIDSHTSYYTSSGVTWYYNDVDYTENGYWGEPHYVGSAWIDKYGYYHINIQDNKGLTTCDQSEEWCYIAKAGYSEDFGDGQFFENWDTTRVDALYDLYLLGEGHEIIGNKKWSYVEMAVSGHEYGDYWVENGMLYIYLSDGVCLVGEVLSFEDDEYWAQIQDSANSADSTGYGSVDHYFNMAKYEVTNAQYAEFLNAVAATDTYGLYYTSMASRGISRSGSSGSFTYSVNDGWADRPVVYVTWYDVLRFVNWLENGKPTGDQTAGTTEDGTYMFVNGSLSANYYDGKMRNPLAMYWMPDENDWYKAAYYDNEGAGVYYDYPMGSDVLPVAEVPPGGENSANYYDSGYVSAEYLTTQAGAYFDSESPYETYDQGGNAYEWTETIYSSGRVIRGGSYANASSRMLAATRLNTTPTNTTYYLGFRIASMYLSTDDDVKNVIEDAEIAFGKDWSEVDINGLQQLVTTTHTSYTTSSGETWYYNNVNYWESGYWGTAHYDTAVWTDKYGYSHISFGNEGLSNYNQASEWGYIAHAGYSAQLNQLFAANWTNSEVNTLYNLYVAGEGSVIVDSTNWYYSDYSFSGYSAGDYWVADNERYICLGSGVGVTTYNSGAEYPATWTMIRDAGDDSAFGVDWNTSDIDQLHNLYLSAQSSVALVVDDVAWIYLESTYFAESGYSVGDHWIDAGKRYIYLAEGVALTTNFGLVYYQALCIAFDKQIQYLNTGGATGSIDFSIPITNEGLVSHSLSDLNVNNENSSLVTVEFVNDPADITLAAGESTNLTLRVTPTQDAPDYADVTLSLANEGPTYYESYSNVRIYMVNTNKPDLNVAVNDVSFAPLNPAENESFTITATIQNVGNTDASNIDVLFSSFTFPLGDNDGIVTIPYLAAGSEIQIIQQVSSGISTVGRKIIEVQVDSNDVHDELDENNNYASKMITIGTPEVIDGGIRTLASVKPTILRGSTVKITGSADYALQVNGEMNYDYPVKGGTVAIEIKTVTGEVVSQFNAGYTTSSGSFRVYFKLPSLFAAGDGVIFRVSVTDYTFIGYIQLQTQVYEYTAGYTPPDDDYDPYTPLPVDDEGYPIAYSSTDYPDDYDGDGIANDDDPFPYGPYSIAPSSSYDGTRIFRESGGGIPSQYNASYTGSGSGTSFSVIPVSVPTYYPSYELRVIHSPVYPASIPDPYTDFDFDVYVHSEDIGFSIDNPDSYQEIYIGAIISGAGEGYEENIPVEFFEVYPGYGETRIGTVQYIEELSAGTNYAMYTSWQAFNDGVYIIEAHIDDQGYSDPDGYSDYNNSNNEASRAIIVGDLNGQLDVFINSPMTGFVYQALSDTMVINCEVLKSGVQLTPPEIDLFVLKFNDSLECLPDIIMVKDGVLQDGVEYNENTKTYTVSQLTPMPAGERDNETDLYPGEIQAVAQTSEIDGDETVYLNGAEQVDANVTYGIDPPDSLDLFATSYAVQLTWTVVDGVTSYAIYRNDEQLIVVDDVAGETTMAYIDYNVIRLETYTYCVHSVDPETGIHGLVSSPVAEVTVPDRRTRR